MDSKELVFFRFSKEGKASVESRISNFDELINNVNKREKFDDTFKFSMKRFELTD